MRPRGVTRAEMPGTMAWGHSGKCKSCVQPHAGRTTKPAVTAETAPPEAVDCKEVHREDTTSALEAFMDGRDAHLEHTIAGLNSFLARRERRLWIQASKVSGLPLRRTA